MTAGATGGLLRYTAWAARGQPGRDDAQPKHVSATWLFVLYGTSGFLLSVIVVVGLRRVWSGV
ncbi:MAG: hypothetical protein NVS2B7_24020 [Herpetosiphon sp.]